MNYNAFLEVAEAAPLFRNAPRSYERIGDILLRETGLSPGALLTAIAKQRHEDAKLGQILLANQAITTDQLSHCLSIQSNIELISVEQFGLSEMEVQIFGVEQMLDLNFVPLTLDKDIVKIAIADPLTLPEIRAICDVQKVKPKFVLADTSKIQARIAQISNSDLVKMAESNCPEENSCRQILSNNYIPTIALSLIASFLIFYWFGLFQTALLITALVVFSGNAVLKLCCLIAHLRHMPPSKPDPKPRKLEKVSILVPLLKEKEIIQRLIPRLENINYPKELLEICLICEEQDHTTREAIKGAVLPPHFRIFIAPKGSIETKPRALNYAISFCSGSIITVYDAEDAPEADQVYKAVRHLQSCAPEVVCVQARLDFFNQNVNWLARCFTIEYAILFRVILRGLQNLKLPIPLGGTSMFIRKPALDALGHWDAHNVTEDADLGVRLFRAGYRVECLDSTTYEEANHRFVPWVKQRSRWLKGFFITWLTHMRNPIKLFREAGLKGFLTFNILMLGSFLTYLLLPLTLPFWALTFAVNVPFVDPFQTSLFGGMILLLIVAEPVLMFIGFIATGTEKHRPLRWVLPSIIAYWPLASLAAYKALYELIVAPVYWDKTEHGITDEEFVGQINALTQIKAEPNGFAWSDDHGADNYQN